MEALAQFTNTETGMTALVYANTKAGFNVVVRDDDAGEMLPFAILGFKSLEAATAKAREVLQ